MQNDITLGYSPACGGFLLFHLLLLSGQYHAEFVKSVDVATAIANQWNIKNHSVWKQSEHWPDNDKTRLCNSATNKIYFYCNPSIEEFTKQSARKIMLYSDVNTQLALARYKNAHWYYNRTQFGLNRDFLAQWNKHYNAIKAEDWPDCRSFKKISALPEAIQQELMSNPYTQSYLQCRSWQDYIVNNHTLDYQTAKVTTQTFELLSTADDCISLKELVNSQCKILVDKHLIDKVNVAQLNLLNHWLKLHSTQLLDQIGLKY